MQVSRTQPIEGSAVSAANDAADQASRCRRLAQAMTDRSTVEALEKMAADYERQARGG